MATQKSARWQSQLRLRARFTISKTSLCQGATMAADDAGIRHAV